jgi:putative hemolysin
VLPEFGVKGLYSSTLFRFSPRFFAQDDNALELGRAFVTAPYQRDYAPLMLLWKGIAHFVLRRPGVRRLFGPVSISLEYSRYSLSALTEFLRLHHQDNTLAAMVSGRKPPRYKMDKRAPDMLNMQGMHFNGLCNLVKDIEGGRTVPVLFKHYLKLGGRIGGFHVDTAFRTLDAFLCIDLADAPPAMLQRYMGREQAVTFLRRCQHSACQISSGR